jgi:hypothetical protein
MLIGLTQPPHDPAPRLPQIQPPMVYVYEPQEWEYKVVVRNAAEKDLLSERELNELGARGWELVGVAALSGKAQFYFKRVRR